MVEIGGYLISIIDNDSIIVSGKNFRWATELSYMESSYGMSKYISSYSYYNMYASSSKRTVSVFESINVIFLNTK